MDDRRRFIWGLVGALVPEAVRLYFIVGHHPQSLPQFSPVYFIISGVFIVLAGLFTIACQPRTPFRAVWIGIAFPSIASLLMKTIPSLPLSST